MNKVLLSLVLLLSLSSAYAGSCFDKPYDVADCKVKAEQGNVGVNYILGMMYELGHGVLQDDKQAVKWYRKGAEQGHAEAQYNLGLIYYEGAGVIQDDVMAHMYFNVAAASGLKRAATHRGIVAKKMTPSQLAEAQKLAREWMRKH